MDKAVKEYLAGIGRKGGEAGTGAAKTRDTEHYREMARRSAATRRNNKKLREAGDK